MKNPVMPLSLIFFSVIVSFAETLGVIVASFQSAILPYATGIGIATALVDGVLNFFGIDIADTVLGALFTASIVPFFLHFFIALIVLIIFFSFYLASSKGTYTVLDCVIAISVFFIESLPIVGGLTCWAFFIWYLRSRQKVKTSLNALGK